MNALKLMLPLAIVMLFAPTASAAYVHGNVYDFDLEEIIARVSIDTVPAQFLVAKNSTYGFTVPSGAYTLTAEVVNNGTTTSRVRESVVVKSEGDYVIDLVLFPVLDGEQQDIEELDAAMAPEPVFPWTAVVVAMLLFAGAGVAYWKFGGKKTHSDKASQADKPAHEVVADDVAMFVRKEGGRVNQKDICKQFPLSAAKISLILSDLEHKGVIEKIKKGRANIVVLK
ncbi:hypothetical protein HY642_00070 [Candidatus Woesearchaeota archaeon]|nr:hypothetical protein [Candidatus Woesearchaeota archaeon]